MKISASIMVFLMILSVVDSESIASEPHQEKLLMKLTCLSKVFVSYDAKKSSENLSYVVTDASCLEKIIKGVRQMNAVEQFTSKAPKYGITIAAYGAGEFPIASLEVFREHMILFESDGVRYKGTLPNSSSLYDWLATRWLSDDPVHVAARAIGEYTPANLDHARKMASEAAVWRVTVRGGEHATVSYEINDPMVMQKLAELITSDQEMDISMAAIAALPDISVDLVHKKEGDVVAQILLIERVLRFTPVKAKRRSQVDLTSHELYQRLLDRNLIFPVESKAVQ